MVDHSFYTDIYQGGSISFDEWPPLERMARAQLERFKRIYRVRGEGDAEKMAICEMAETIQRHQDSGGVTSASLGSVSESYAVQGDPLAMYNRELYWAAATYLDIYRGC